MEGGAPTEAFANETALAERLADVGFGTLSIRKNIFDLRNEKDTNWSNLEVAPDVFESFGREGKAFKPMFEPLFERGDLF
jgi:hypothetical protein